MELNQGQPEAADEAAVLPSEPWLLHDFDKLLDNNLFDLSYDTPRLGEPLTGPSCAEFDAGYMVFPENDIEGIQITNIFPEPLADPSSAACNADDVALLQDDSGEIPNTLVFSDQIVSDFLADRDSAVSPAPDPIASTSSNTLPPQPQAPGLALSASDNTSSLIISTSTVRQSSGPVNQMHTSHQDPNPLLCPPVTPLASYSITNRTVDPSIQLGIHTAPGSMQSQPAGTVQTMLQPFEGPQPSTIWQTPNTAVPQLEPPPTPQATRPRQPKTGAASFRPIAPKETSLDSSSLAVQGPLPSLALRTTGQSSNSKLKRRLSIHEDLGRGFFPLNPSAELARKSGKRPKKYSEHVCLRCYVQNKGCSDTFPCERCLALWENTKYKRTKATLAYRNCFDCDVREFDAFYTIWDRCFVPGVTTRDICLQDKLSSPELIAFDWDLSKALNVLCFVFESIVAHTMVDAGLAHFDRMQSGLLDDGGKIPPQKPLAQYLPAQKTYDKQFLSFWIMAVLHWHPDAVAYFTKASALATWTLRAMASKHVFERVNYLIRKFKSKPSSMTSKHREELTLSLITIQEVPRSLRFFWNTFGFVYGHVVPAARRQSTGAGAATFQYPKEDSLAEMLLDQHHHLSLLTFYWLERLCANLTPDAVPRIDIYRFSLVVLSRLDFSQKWMETTPPVDQAIKFLSELKATKANIDALQWEKQNRSLGELPDFMGYLDRLDTLKESMATSQVAGTPSSSPSQHDKP